MRTAQAVKWRGSPTCSSAIGTEPRLRIMRLLLAAHPDGLVVGEIGAELGIASSTLSHHLEKLRNEDLVTVRREGTFLRYSANAAALQELLAFLYAECCTRSQAVEPEADRVQLLTPRIPDDRHHRRQGSRPREVRRRPRCA